MASRSPSTPAKRSAWSGRNGAANPLSSPAEGSRTRTPAILSGAHWQKAEVAQNMPETASRRRPSLLDGDARMMALRAELTRAEDGEDGIAIAHSHSDLADAGEHDAARARSRDPGPGFRPHELDQPVNRFPEDGACACNWPRADEPSDLLLLDEPPTHLDLDALVWMEGWRQRYNGTLIIISHREFSTGHRLTLHIEQTTTHRYGSNYRGFELLRASSWSSRSPPSQTEGQDRPPAEFIDRFKAKASKAKHGASRVKALERMEKIAPVLANAEYHLRVQGAGEPAEPELGDQRCGVRLRRRQGHPERRQPLGDGRPAHRHPGAKARANRRW